MKQSDQYKLDERNHVEKPLLDQLAGLGWEIIDLSGRSERSAKGAKRGRTKISDLFY
ncbi:MAG: hypothetical protein R6U40_01835 [Desulfobacterales bacterium]